MCYKTIYNTTKNNVHTCQRLSPFTESLWKYNREQERDKLQ